MTTTGIIDCPPDAPTPPFSSLGAINRIGDAFCQSTNDFQCIADMQSYRSFRMNCLRTTLAIVDACRMPNQATISVRLKRLDSIRRKIERTDTDFALGRLDDVVGVRILCEDLATTRELSNRIQASSYFYRLKDYIAEPAATGYRGINHIMRFQQPVTKVTELPMRFEIQARTYLQHLWAVWSESHSEAVKLGMGGTQEQEDLRMLSEKIARWEANNPATRQIKLSDYSSGRSIAVCWRPRHGPIMISHFFTDEVREAVSWLNNLEIEHPNERTNALLLVGIAKAHDTSELERLLQLTHPLFAGGQVLKPEYWDRWMPSSSSQR